ncbi:cAMP-dependent protein kinase type II regulatory subunit [Orchesella cincta]|uniref:cAMP-dependent protein kinase type II regulatory subunit n=1 Tax=Orchesella cincta TaxID=48709 RepID=A0A1D2MJ80_ORCCI|nr:cAMP-dependent protein kinase type II regulatory subunit [Orchesella cincta]
MLPKPTIISEGNNPSPTSEEDSSSETRLKFSPSPNPEDGEPDPTPPVRNVGRRKSVFAEAYNPEEDEDDKPSVVHPKSDSQRSRLAEAVKHILLFRSLDAEQMQEVIDAMFERKVTAGEYVIKQGDDGDNFYVIESGKYKVFVKFDGEQDPKHVAGYDGTGSFGELALMYNMPRAATVQSDSNGSLWAMDRQTFRRIVLKNAYKKRQMYETLIESVPMLKTLENYERMNLADALVPRVYTNGETIIKQGDAADGMYFVEDGDTRVVKIDGNGEEKEINRTSKGGYFGELALLTKKPRAATVIAAGNVKLAFLDVDAFERLLGPCMDLMKRNAEDYEQQLIRIFGSKSNITDIRQTS